MIRSIIFIVLAEGTLLVFDVCSAFGFLLRQNVSLDVEAVARETDVCALHSE